MYTTLLLFQKYYFLDETTDSPIIYRSVARRKTDLMPTIPIHRDTFGSRSSLYSNSPRMSGKN